MKNIAIKFAFILCVFAVSDLFAAVGDPGVPPSSRNRYPAAPARTNPYASGQYQLGNDIVTGNVTGGKHFRGVVPYGSAYEFRGVQGSSTLNDFYRRAASVPKITSSNPRQTQRYFLPSSNVTSTSPTNPGNAIDNSYRLRSVDNQINLVGANLDKVQLETDYQTRQPYLEKLTKRPMARDMYDVKLGLEKYLQSTQEQTDQTRDETQPDKLKTDNTTRTSMLEKDTLFQPLLQKTDQTELLNKQIEYDSRFPDPKITKPEKTIDTKNDYTVDVFEQMQSQFTENVEKLTQSRIEQQKQQQQDEQDKKIAQQKAIEEMLTQPAPSTTEETTQPTPEQMETIVTFATDTEDDFNKYMTQAESFITQGMYYKAADAYAVASAYRNDNPLPYLGRSIALFAAGEYMSSAYYLDISLRIFKQLALFDIDIKKMIADEDVFDKRMSELVELQIQSGSAELNFLRAYIYLNTGKLRNAKEAINDAAEKMPDDKATQILKNAIDQRQ